MSLTAPMLLRDFVRGGVPESGVWARHARYSVLTPDDELSGRRSGEDLEHLRFVAAE
jgi:hypothetical protein